MEIIIRAILSYLIGSLSGSLILGKIRGIDIRKEGSGNAGSTNAFRTQGKLFALIVLLIDVLKGIVAVVFIANVFETNSNISPYICGGAVIIGHVYPILFGFKGGKGAGTAIGVVGAINPVVLLIAIPVWIVVLVLSGFVGLATMLSSISIPVYLYFAEVDINFSVFSLILALFVVFTHRSNIRRMINGTENCFEKAKILRNSKQI